MHSHQTETTKAAKAGGSSAQQGANPPHPKRDRMTRKSATSLQQAEIIELIEMGNGADRIYWIIRTRAGTRIAYVSGTDGTIAYASRAQAEQTARRLNRNAQIRVIGIHEDATDPRALSTTSAAHQVN